MCEPGSVGASAWSMSFERALPARVSSVMKTDHSVVFRWKLQKRFGKLLALYSCVNCSGII